MLDVSSLSPSVGSIHAQPMTAAEIDAHPDGDRIWATITALRSEQREDFEDAVKDEVKSRARDYGRLVDDAVRDAKEILNDLLEATAE